MSQALIVRNDASLTVSFTEQAIALRESVLDKSALIAKVTDADEQRIAVESQAEIATLLRDAEKARVACKEPVLEFGRNIDARAKEYTTDLRTERDRLDKLVGDFQALEAARVKAAEAARLLEQQRIEEARMKAEREAREAAQAEQRRLNAQAEEARRKAAEAAEAAEAERRKLNAQAEEARRKVSEAKNSEARAAAEKLRIEIERERKASEAKNAADAEKARTLQMEIEREQKVSQAASLQQIETIRANSSEEIAALPVAATARVDGQRVTQEWNITVSDILALARAHPACVKIEPRLSEIKALLDSGAKVAGVIAKKEIKSTVRAGTGRAAIEV